MRIEEIQDHLQKVILANKPTLLEISTIHTTGPVAEFGTMIRSYKRQVCNACVRHAFQPSIIDHCSIKSLPNSEIDAIVI